MTHYTGTIPASSKRKDDWRDAAACKDHDPDAMFPDSHEPDIRYARSICATCPVAMPCLIDALDVNDNDHGIRGGLKPGERRAVRQEAGDEYRDPEVLAAAIIRVLHPGTGDRTLREVWEEHTTPMAGGHLKWTGSNTFSFRGHSYSPKRAAFLIHRGREPKGIVRRTPDCPVVECVHPLHVEDNVERHRRVERQRAAAEARSTQAA